MRLDDLSLSATVSMDERRFSELDSGTALSNRLLDGLFAEFDPGRASESVADIRRNRATALGAGAWLIIDVTGDHPRAVPTEPTLVPDLGLSFELVDEVTPMFELGGYSAKSIHRRIVGTICIAAEHNIRTRAVTQGWWFVGPDDLPHHLIKISGSGRGIVSVRLRDAAEETVSRLLSIADSDSRIASALAAFGQSLEWDLDPALEFLSAFTGLELLIKARTGAPIHSPSATRTGLARRFENLVGDDSADCLTFDHLYAERNGLAHEARFTARAADQARRLFERQLRAAAAPAG